MRKINFYIKTIFLLFFIITITSCKKENKTIYFSEIKFNNHECIRSKKQITKLSFHKSNDSIIDSCNFWLDGNQHSIKQYTNLFVSPIDGEYFIYEVDKLGIVFAYSQSWKSYSKFISNKDSINNIIELGLGIMLMESKD